MCGVSGFLGPPAARRAEFEHTISRMTAAVYHRGPDDEGTWVDAEAGVALGHRRLAIIDLTSEGHQPMHSACRSIRRRIQRRGLQLSHACARSSSPGGTAFAVTRIPR